jgi:hypothetical protein
LRAILRAESSVASAPALLWCSLSHTERLC